MAFRSALELFGQFSGVKVVCVNCSERALFNEPFTRRNSICLMACAVSVSVSKCFVRFWCVFDFVEIDWQTTLKYFQTHEPHIFLKLGSFTRLISVVPLRFLLNQFVDEFFSILSKPVNRWFFMFLTRLFHIVLIRWFQFLSVVLFDERVR